MVGFPRLFLQAALYEKMDSLQNMRLHSLIVLFKYARVSICCFVSNRSGVEVFILRTTIASSLVVSMSLLWSSSALAVTITSQKGSSPYPGVRVVALRTSHPKTRAWAAYIDLCQDYVHIDATTTPKGKKTVGKWASSVGAQLATNGDFFKTKGGPLRVYGQAVGSGKPWSLINTGAHPTHEDEWYYRKYGWIAFGPDWVTFSHTQAVKLNPEKYHAREGFLPAEVTHAIPQGTIALVSGFPELVIEGKPVTCASPTDTDCFPDRSDMEKRHPRTAMGLTEDRRTFILTVVDGRSSISSGMYGIELADLMHQLGAWEAFNLDGGGSTQMWLRGKGYLNNFSTASPRPVANHWAVFAGSGNGKARKPGHCVDYLHGAVLQSLLPSPRRGSTDFDGDGRADACIRSENGIVCARGRDNELGDEEAFVELSDASGWADLTNYGTLRMGDIDGDGKADLCSRANAGIRCWTSDSEPFDTPIIGPAFSDKSGWYKPQYYSTMRLADVNGDGRDDLCARATDGLRCYLSTGDGFGDALITNLFSDADGFEAADKYATLRMGDIDGDGLADVCARNAEGMECYRSDGKGFPSRVPGPPWADASGWHRPRYFSTIRLVDVDGDGRDDLCTRSAFDFRCHLSQGNAFGDPIIKDILSDNSGWDDPSNYGTIRLADLDADGDADLCARANVSMVCWPWEGSSFGDPFDGPNLDDANGWNRDRKYRSLRFADINGDRRADLCGLDDDGLFCFPGQGSSFGDKISGPAWAGLGWMNPSVYGTLLLSGPACRPSEEICNGQDDDCDFEVDEGCGEDGGTGGFSGADGGGGQAGSSSSAGNGNAGDYADPWEPQDSDGCACSIPDHARGPGGWFLALSALSAMFVRRRRTSTRSRS